MDVKRLLARIDELQDEYVQFWVDICNIESPTSFKPGVDAVGRYFIEKTQNRGWKVRVHKEAVSGDAVCITMNPEAEGKPVCFSGHMDTVHPVGNFGTPAVRVEGDTIYGPGVKDCKGGTVGAFLAMAALEDCGFAARPVKLILQSDEENSSTTSNKATLDFMAECARDCVVFLNAEGHSKNKATLWRKGISRYQMIVHGVSCHAAGCYESGVNAVHEAAAKVMEIEKYKDPQGICMNCGIISGGTAGNVVPGTCEIVIDVRYFTLKDMEKADQILRDIAAKSFLEGSRTELVKTQSRPPMEKTEGNMNMLRLLNGIYESVGLPILEETWSPGGSDGADMTVRGITVVDAVGVRGKGIHSLREQASIASLAECAKRLAVAAALL